MSDDYNAAFDRAVDRQPFSNGTMWDMWSSNWCCRCRNDGMGVGKDKPQCELILVALMGRTPAEWVTPDANSEIFGDYHCLSFRDRRDPGAGREPRPVPDPPGQGAMFDRETYTGVRMPVTADEPVPVAVG